jgi:hypothetical protein
MLLIVDQASSTKSQLQNPHIVGLTISLFKSRLFKALSVASKTTLPVTSGLVYLIENYNVPRILQNLSVNREN